MIDVRHQTTLILLESAVAVAGFALHSLQSMVWNDDISVQLLIAGHWLVSSAHTACLPALPAL